MHGKEIPSLLWIYTSQSAVYRIPYEVFFKSKVPPVYSNFKTDLVHKTHDQNGPENNVNEEIVHPSQNT